MPLPLILPLILPLAFAAPAADLSTAFHDAAATHAVPEKVLLALAYEASHWRAGSASAWGGYGLFDLREDGEGGPSIERAAILAGQRPDDVIARPSANVDAAAALLAHEARLSTGGVAPDPTDLLAWWDAVRAFSRVHDPVRQERFASTIYEAINFGIPLDAETGLSLTAEPVNHWMRVPPAPPPTACDYSGCASFTAASSSNYTNDSRGASDIDYVIIHTVQGSYSGCISWFQNSSANVSAHYVVRSSDGEVTQMVQEEDVGWHAGNWAYNQASVGIEHEGYVDDPGTWYTDAMYNGSAALTADIASRNGIPIDRNHIIGHVEVPGATHTDPGTGWDWSRYMDLVNTYAGGGGGLTGNLIGVVADTDIYNGTRLEGARVWIEETGEAGASDASGYYRFYDLPIDHYTVHACADGFAEATCASDISTGDNWCSIALTPGSGCSLDGGGDTGGGDGGGDDGGDDSGEPQPGDDSGNPDSGQPDSGGLGSFSSEPPGKPPGEAVAFADTRGCSTSGAASQAGAAALGLMALASLMAAARRRREDD
jgi:hypothetical protein